MAKKNKGPFVVTICPEWNGKDKVCDTERSVCYIAMPTERSGSCYHKPFLMRPARRGPGKRYTVVEAISLFLEGGPDD